MIMISITCILTGASPVSSIANIGKRDTTQEDTADDDDNEEVRNTRHDNHLLCLLNYKKILQLTLISCTNLFSLFFNLLFSSSFSHFFLLLTTHFFLVSIIVGSIRHGHYSYKQ